MANELNLKIHGMSLETQKQVSRKKLLDCAIDKFKDQLRDLEDLVRHEPSCSKTLLLRRVAKLHREHNLERKREDDDDVIVLKKMKKTKTKKKKKKKKRGQNNEKDVPQQEDDLRKEQNRQRQYLENAAASLRQKLVKDRERHKSNIRKLVRENTTLTSEVNKLRRELRSLDQKKRGGGKKHSRSNSITETEAQKEIELQRMKIEELEAFISDYK